jgi:hypothetical protein
MAELLRFLSFFVLVVVLGAALGSYLEAKFKEPCSHNRNKRYKERNDANN